MRKRKKGKQGKGADRGVRIKREKKKEGRKGNQEKEMGHGCQPKEEQRKQAKQKSIKKT